MTRYLARDILNKCAINNFDDWAANFAGRLRAWNTPPTALPSSRRPRWRTTSTVPELQSIWSQFADVMMQDEAEEAGYITLPKAVRQRYASQSDSGPGAIAPEHRERGETAEPSDERSRAA